MQKIKVLSIIGTRPEAIKMAPVVRELKKLPDRFSPVVCSTGQHREMLDPVLELFGITPEHDFDIMERDQSLARLTSRLVLALDAVLAREPFDWILAQGDTTTVLAASLCALYHKIPFGHIEAGLRTGDLHRPFPEEANRRVADCLATLFFAPTPRARDNLLRQGVAGERIHVTGNTVVDALLDIASRDYDWAAGPLAALGQGRRIVYVTAHRRESFGRPLEELCAAIRHIAGEFRGDGVVLAYPVHLNPCVQVPVRELLSGIDNVVLLPPLGYLDAVHVMKRAALILTDSGGIQEEAPTLGVPVLVMRDVTERQEAVEAGAARLVGTSRERIIMETRKLLTDAEEYGRMRCARNPFGDGTAAEKIVSRILENAGTNPCTR